MPVAKTPVMLDAALELVAQGYRVFPCHTPKVTKSGTHCSCNKLDCASVGKHPRTLKGCTDASGDEKQVREWWGKWADANIGVATGGGLVVLDVDPDKGGTSNGLDLPDTRRSVTGSGGEHWYLLSDGERVPNSVELVGPGLDVRGEGGYVIAPPSLHESGRRYAWDVGGGETTEPAPKWFLASARQKRAKALADGPAAADAFVSGGRNDALTALAGAMRRRGFGAPAITAALIQENAARCRPPLDEPEVRRVAEGVARRYTPAAPVKGWAVLGWTDLSSVLPNIPWLCKELSIAPGAPTLVAGYGFSGKTVSLQSLALAVAAGRQAWGKFDVGQGGVLHVDYEQGRHLTQLRYQRLAIEMGVWQDELAGKLDLLTLPPTYLDADGEIERLSQLCEGKRLCIIDSLKAAFPTCDENSSDVRKHLDGLTRISEATGCVFMVIHHARKPSKEHTGMAAMAIRGSGAIFDACGGVFIFGGEKGRPTTVVHDKARITGRTAPDFALEVSDVSLPAECIPEAALAVTVGDGLSNESGSLRYGLRVACVSADGPSVEEGTKALEKRILELVARFPGIGKRRIREHAKGDSRLSDRAIGLLLEEGHLRQAPGVGKGHCYFATAGEREDDD